MRISYNWLKDYIDIKVSPEKLAELLTMAGLGVDSVEKKALDHILEVEVTANRPDWLSLTGIARELSAITGGKLKIPSIRHCEGAKRPKQSLKAGLLRRAEFTPNLYGSGPSSQRRIAIMVEDKDLCPRYTARIIRDVKVGESAAWIKTRLEAAGLRPVNNAADITNLCLFETGEPMHAFDMDSLDGGEIIVRKARKGEKIVTIDGTERSLDETILVIADASRPVAIAGVMGGLNTEVTRSTKNILLEAAYFDPVSIRRTSRKLGISTESSYRFERKADIVNIPAASDRAAQLISDATGGKIGNFLDTGGRPHPKKEITLEYKRLNEILGLKIPDVKVKKILRSLGLKAKSSSGDKAKFEIPSFRYDLNEEIDLVEEVSRIYGYDKIPSTIPGIVEQPLRRPYEAVVSEKIRLVLTGLGCDEIITYSLMSRRLLDASLSAGEGVVEVRNPFTSEQEVMRPNLVAGICGAVLWNLNRKNKNVKLFELGKVYKREGGDRFVEPLHLSIVITGEVSSGWGSGPREAGFFDLKGIVETLFSKLGLGKIVFGHVEKNGFSPIASASIAADGEVIGTIGEVSRKVLNNFDIKEKVYLCEICVDSLMKHIRLEKRFAQLPKYPSVSRDISMVVSKGVGHADLTSAVREAAGSLLKDVSLIDRYSGKQIPDDKIGLTYRLEYQDIRKTLEDKEVSELHARILGSLEEKFGAKPR